MVDVSVVGDRAVFEVEGMDKLWALRSRLEIPLAHITQVHADTKIAHGWYHGIRLPGTEIPGILTAGTFYRDHKVVFWDVHHPDSTIVIELDHEHYDRLVIEVHDPASTIALLNSKKGSAGD